MGLDLGIVKRRKGEAYSLCSWEDVCWWRNCWKARVIMLDCINSYDAEAQEAPINLGAMQKMIEELIKEVHSCNINEQVVSDDTIKIYQCISDLAKIIHDEMWSWYWGDPEYDYKLIDSY